MKLFEVFDAMFNHVGFVEAHSAEAALREAKRKYPKVFAPMVQEVTVQ